MFHQYQEPACPQSQLFAVFETQKRICQQYIKIASQQLYAQEAQTLSNANQLLQKLASKEVVKDLSEWDVFSTRDSVILEDESNSFNLSTLSVETRGKHIQRKSVRGTRELEGSLNDCLAEIEENCSAKTYTTVKKVADEYRKLKLKMFECEKKQEKSMRVRERLIEEMQQKNVILSTRIEDIEVNLEKLRNENLTLKANNAELNEQLHQKNTEINSEKKIKLFEEIMTHHQHASPTKPQPGSSLDLLTGVLREKERLITSRVESIQKIQEKIEGQLFGREGSCQRCCEVLRKMKESIIAYKRYLQKQGEEFQKLVDHFKLQILGSQVTGRD